jgi:hypothetical protein
VISYLEKLQQLLLVLAAYMLSVGKQKSYRSFSIFATKLGKKVLPDDFRNRETIEREKRYSVYFKFCEVSERDNPHLCGLMIASAQIDVGSFEVKVSISQRAYRLWSLCPSLPFTKECL